MYILKIITILKSITINTCSLKTCGLKKQTKKLQYLQLNSNKHCWLRPYNIIFKKINT